jgi:hypothetical protein
MELSMKCICRHKLTSSLVVVLSVAGCSSSSSGGAASGHGGAGNAAAPSSGGTGAGDDGGEPAGGVSGNVGTRAANGGTRAANGGSGGASGTTGMVVTPGDPGAHDVLFTIDTTANRHPISPYIYGTNQGDLTKEARNLTLTRVGGNRLTAYNWETNASNAGSDYMYENDDYISSSKVAGDPMKQAVKDAADNAASIIMTVPMAGWVSADESGPVDSNPASTSVIQQHFFPILPKKGSAFVYPPDTSDGKVYADEFVGWMESQFPDAQTDQTRRIFYMLDNEPDLWASTHREIHPAPVTYAELIKTTTVFASAIKAAAPNTLVFGPASYGWNGYVNLQNAPDAQGRDFIEFYLDSMKSAEQSAGMRLLDVLDVHWYPEATGDGKRITDDGVTSGEVAARLQAPRSLWDSTYTENSWITQSMKAPIELIPRLQKKIDAHYPGTKLSISEYNYGAGNDISGGLAEADVLGVFGREGLYEASMWEVSKSSFIFAGFAMYRSYDGSNGSFGDTSVGATTSAVDQSSVYASVDSANGTNVVVVAINKQGSAQRAGITLKHAGTLNAADIYTLTSATAKPVKGAALTKVATNAFSYTMPAYSATTLVFHP